VIFRTQTIQIKTFSVAIHGGAGTLVKGMMTPELETEYKSVLKLALNEGYRVLQDDGNAIDAVETVVKFLEDLPLFNAGKGAVFTAAGTHEMDASIMDGKTLEAGEVTLAKDVMQKSEHVFLAGDGAMEFAKQLDYKVEDASYFYNEFRHKQWLEIKDTNSFQFDHAIKKDSKFGTVGAVACDKACNIAA
jgi:beta-aspartyl-peptidase (threonine type)